MTVAVFAANGIGDALMMWPTLRALSAGFKGDLILASDTRITAALYVDVAFKARLHVSTHLMDGTRRFDAHALARGLRECEALVCLNSWHSTSTDALLRALPDTRTFGFFPSFDEVLDARGWNAFDAYFNAAERLTAHSNIEDYADAPVFEATAMALHRPHKSLNVTMHIETARAKAWNEGNAMSIVRAFKCHYPYSSVQMVGVARHRLRRLCDGADATMIAGRPFEIAAAAVAQSDLFIGCDSCMLHVADLARVPSIAVFRSTSPSVWGCRFTRNEVLWLQRTSGRVGMRTALDAIERVIDQNNSPATRARSRLRLRRVG